MQTEKEIGEEQGDLGEEVWAPLGANSRAGVLSLAQLGAPLSKIYDIIWISKTLHWVKKPNLYKIVEPTYSRKKIRRVIAL